MPSGTALLQSPGRNEGKARYETLGKPRQKWIELLQERHFRREYLSLGVPPLIGAPLCLPYQFIILIRLPWCYAMVFMKLRKSTYLYIELR